MATTTSNLTSVLSRLPFSLEALDGKISHYLSLVLSNPTAITYASRALKVLAGYFVVSRTNRALNWWARNYWAIRIIGQPFDFSGNKEVAVVTGGSSGFGLLIAKGPSQHCRVAVLDVQFPPEELLKNANITVYRCDLTQAAAIHLLDHHR